jgi:hypothetical protein
LLQSAVRKAHLLTRNPKIYSKLCCCIGCQEDHAAAAKLHLVSILGWFWCRSSSLFGIDNMQVCFQFLKR